MGVVHTPHACDIGVSARNARVGTIGKCDGCGAYYRVTRREYAWHLIWVRITARQARRIIRKAERRGNGSA